MLYVLAPNSHIQYTQLQQQQQHHLLSSCVVGRCLPFSEPFGFGFDHYSIANTPTIGRGQWNNQVAKQKLRAGSFWQDLSRPVSVDMESINDSEQLDQILLNAQQLSQPIIIDWSLLPLWMASWCRKCIYLKPKLEKLAAEFDSKIKFYYVDVNKVPQALVKRGNISKMPTIQLWKDGEKQAEIIGGHKGWLVVDEVREMIQKYV